MSTQEKLQQEINRFIQSAPVSQGKQTESEKYLPGGSSRGTAFFDPYPHFIERGEGHYIYDADGNRLLDFMINATSLILGHAHPDVTQAIQEQAARGTAFTGPTDPQVRLAKILTERVPSLDLIRFTNSGTEGTMMAIRAARAYTGRQKIAKFEGGYHGAHEYVSVSVRPPLEKLDPSGPTPIAEHPGLPDSILDQVIVLPYNDLDWCERVLRENASELACLIMEPVVSSFGYLPGDADFLRGLRDLTTELGIVLIYDEVQSLPHSSGRRAGNARRRTRHDRLRQDYRRRNASRRVRRPSRHNGTVRPHERSGHTTRRNIQRQPSYHGRWRGRNEPPYS